MTLSKQQFENRIKKVMAHNNYTPDMITASACGALEEPRWSPLDLILREYYNNGGGSAKGFLGLTKGECIACYEYARDHQEELKQADLYNERGVSNWGFTLWDNYIIH